MVPDRAGADTHVMVHIGLAQLRDMPGGSAAETAWLAGRVGRTRLPHRHRCDRRRRVRLRITVPVVTGYADMTVIDTIIDDLALAYAHGGDRGTADGHGGGLAATATPAATPASAPAAPTATATA